MDPDPGPDIDRNLQGIGEEQHFEVVNRVTAKKKKRRNRKKKKASCSMNGEA
jgi:hypothetical protein